MTAQRYEYRAPDTSDLMLHLTKAQKDLLVEISGNKCAWRTSTGGKGRWRPKGQRSGHTLSTGDALVHRDLAMILYGKGPPRLVLNYRGEGLALEIKKERQDRQRSRS
ncbi:hypothetical protein FMN63_24965 [Stappia sp. BW2]|uniref:hypothetical protein n=1 Tax=Stappia sp. BW2 TaxID=2592622 RepID=UPI0011DEDBAF|nr:hypothetical protein [Stappia sp. BW2]TYC65637.1 hypothetical protein FMN63_24965 [Stappia sp. BW2]